MNSNVRKITEVLGKNSNYWAFTGSVALWYHSVNRNMEPRAPHDIDIVIERSSKTFVSTELSSLGWVRQSEGSARITFKKGSKHLDLIFAGSRLGPSLNSIVRYRNSPPIINVQSLFNRKKMITPNAKTRANLSRLRNLGGVTPVRKSPIRVSGGRKLF
jgi:hypothetical protein